MLQGSGAQQPQQPPSQLLSPSERELAQGPQPPPAAQRCTSARLNCYALRACRTLGEIEELNNTPCIVCPWWVPEGGGAGAAGGERRAAARASTYPARSFAGKHCFAGQPRPLPSPCAMCAAPRCVALCRHYYHISLKDGEKWYQGTTPDSTGKLQAGPWKRCGAGGLAHAGLAG